MSFVHALLIMSALCFIVGGWSWLMVKLADWTRETVEYRDKFAGDEEKNRYHYPKR